MSTTVSVEEEADAEDDFEQNYQAYKLLVRLETQVRKFIGDRMTAVFRLGLGKQRVPGDLYESGERKGSKTTLPIL